MRSLTDPIDQVALASALGSRFQSWYSASLFSLQQYSAIITLMTSCIDLQDSLALI